MLIRHGERSSRLPRHVHLIFSYYEYDESRAALYLLLLKFLYCFLLGKVELQKGKVNDTVNVFETYSLSSLTKRIYFTAVTKIRKRTTCTPWHEHVTPMHAQCICTGTCTGHMYTHLPRTRKLTRIHLCKRMRIYTRIQPYINICTHIR